MRQILVAGDYRICLGTQKVDFIDKMAKDLFKESVSYFNHAGLSERTLLQVGSNVYVFTWLGDKTVNTIVALLVMEGFEAGAYAGVIEIEKAPIQDINETLQRLGDEFLLNETELADMVREKCIEKFDEFLPSDLLSQGYGARAFDVASAMKWIRTSL